MDINKDLCIEIAGHINKPNSKLMPKNSWEYGLSVSRAITIYDSLRNNNVKASRMVAKGYANWKMLYPKAKLGFRMAKNRRVEIIVKDCKSIENIKNDSITNVALSKTTNLGISQFNPTDLKFKIETFNQYIVLFSKVDQKKIIESLKYLKGKNIEASKFTYRQLLTKDILKLKRE